MSKTYTEPSRSVQVLFYSELSVKDTMQKDGGFLLPEKSRPGHLPPEMATIPGASGISRKVR